MRSLTLNLLTKGKIKTTEARAKELRKFVEPLITLGKKGTIAHDRLLRARLGTNLDLRKLVAPLAQKYAERKGGYTRVTKLQRRKSDGAPLAVIEFV